MRHIVLRRGGEAPQSWIRCVNWLDRRRGGRRLRRGVVVFGMPVFIYIYRLWTIIAVERVVLVTENYDLYQRERIEN